MTAPSASPAELAGRLASPDPNERAKALAGLVRHGRAATAVVTPLLSAGDDVVRVQAARALAEIADPAASDALAAAVDDGHPEVRGHAAVGLARARDPRGVAALVRTIDDVPDLLHFPYTSAVYALIDLGAAALPAVASLLSAEDPVTRERAFLVVRSVVSELPEGAGWTALWERLGRYDPGGDPADRERAASLWSAWIAEHAGPGPQR